MSAGVQSQTTHRLRNWGARGVVAALIAMSVAGGASSAAAAEPEAQATSAGEQQVTGGSLQWGVRSSIRNYLENFGHTEGWVAAYEGATYQRGAEAASFPVTSGVVDAEAETASIAFAGQLEMFGFGEDWLFFEDVRLEIADGTATIVVDMIESYNVKTRTDDLVIARFSVGADALQATEDGRISLTTGRGTLSEEVGLRHLPSYGGPTYGAPNDWTDPFTLDLALSATGGEGGGETPGEGGNSGGDPVTGPYGVSAGKPYADTAATIRVTPGYAVHADGATELKVEGFGFDPGNATVPGTGSGGLYVGFGTMKDPSQPEKWRRSAGGSSGPVGMGDYTYGVPMFVANQNSADGDVANAMMDASGYWSFTITIPGSNVPSFFGDTIDCLANQCGFFAFGAHGAVKAVNEAFVPVYFVGQDESGWPDRETDDDDDPVVVPTPEKPVAEPTLPQRAALVDENRGSVQIVSTANSTATVYVGTSHTNTWVGAAVYSDPEFIDWYLVPASGRISVPLPAGLEEGDHALAVLKTDASLIGWASFAIDPDGDDGPTTDPEKADPHGTSTGRNSASGATMTVTPARSIADRDQKVTLTGTGYPTSNNGDTFGGVYILFGWVGKDGDAYTFPSAGGSSARDYAYADGQVTYQWMVNYPGNTTEPDAPMMDANGNWTSEFTVYGSSFTSANGIAIDCYQVQCGVFTIGAHGKVNAGVEVFTPVYFDESTPDPDAKPAPVTPPPAQANPNVTQQPGTGLSVNGGLEALLRTGADSRQLIFAGVLVLSLGLLGAALVYAQGLRARAAGTTRRTSAVSGT